jgi:hypothetical protein
VEALLELCANRQVAVQTIKSVARRRWPQTADGPRFSWYEPLPAGEALERAVRFVLANAQLFLNSSSDLRLLRPILEAASTGGPRPSDEELRRDAVDLQEEALFDWGELERI